MNARLLNVQGRILLGKILDIRQGHAEYAFDLMEFGAGVYVLELRTVDGVRFFKIIRSTVL